MEGYSWHAHEQQIVLYSIEYRISVFFCIVGESIDVYFERRSLFSKDSWNFTDILRAKNVTNYPTKFSINSMEDIFSICFASEKACWFDIKKKEVEIISRPAPSSLQICLPIRRLPGAPTNVHWNKLMQGWRSVNKMPGGLF